VKLESVVWPEGPPVLSPTYLYDALRHEREILSHLPCDAYTLYDRATVICMIVAALRRHAADRGELLDSSLQRRVARALQIAEREMHWLALCGGDADEIDLLAAVTSALAGAEQAAALLRTDVSGAFTAATERETNIASDGRYAGFAR
jgi:hypothetical protein